MATSRKRSSARTTAADSSPASQVPEEYPRILVFDDATRTALYKRWLPETVTVLSPPSLEAARDVVGRGVAVAVIRHELPDEKRAAIAELVRSRATHARLLLTTSEHSPVADDCVDAGNCLTEPVHESALTTAVSDQLGMATYALLLRRYYECTAQLAAMEVRTNGNTSERGDRYERFLEHHEDLKASVRTLQKRLTSEQAQTVLRELSPPEFEREPRKAAGAGSAKYRPEKCSDCGREWSVTETGAASGFKRLGAFVWECGDCGSVSDRSNPTNNQLSRFR